jgi:hypoxanthine phosphoribosyltransferase
MAASAKPHILIGRAKIAAAAKRMAAEIEKDYHGRDLLVMGVLKGAFVFCADLVRLIDLPLAVDFIGLSSYHQGKHTSGSIRVTHYPSSSLKGKDLLVVEDIVDTGLTTTFLLDYLKKQGPASLKLCTLTDKPSRRQVPVTVDYLGFTVPDRFIVGYGIDYGERFRNLKDICYVEEG